MDGKRGEAVVSCVGLGWFGEDNRGVFIAGAGEAARD